MKVLLFEGGLGNQMFQYAFFLGERKKHGGLWIYDRADTIYHHQGFELEKIFNVCKHEKLHHFVMRIMRKLRIKQILISENEEASYLETPPLLGIGKCVNYHGFWQNERYFLDVEKKVRKTFAFDESKLNYKTALIYNQIKVQHHSYASVHIRRGDYVGCPIFKVCTADYYKKAMSYLRVRVRDVVFIVFSDDLLWCREQFGEACDTLQYVDWNRGADSWQDMFLMSKCQHNIIANSSFSWWGAWLNSNIDKVVIAPSYWLADENKMKEVVPPNWVRL